MLRKMIILGALPLALATPAGADVNKLTNDEIGLSYRGKWVRVRREDKTTLLGANLPVTVWRKCSTI